MTLSRRAIFGMITLLGLALAGFYMFSQNGGKPFNGGTLEASSVLATVNGTDITAGHLIVLLDDLPAQYQTLEDDVLFNALLEQIIEQTLLQQQMKAGDLRGEILIANKVRNTAASYVIEGIVGEAITPDMIQTAYDEEYGAGGEQEYSAAHILMDTEDEAKAIILELTAGADFAELAKAKSTGPSGASGGDLGWFGAGAMVAPFEAAVLALEVGDISPPVQTQFGWHVIILKDVREVAPPPIASVTEKIAGQISGSIVENHLQVLRSQSQITRHVEGLDPAFIRNNDLVE